MGRGADSGVALDLEQRAVTEISNATALAELGLTREQLDGFDQHHSSPRSFQMISVETPDGDPIVGLQYSCDYRAEEESGMGKLRKKITGEDERNFGMTEEAAPYVAWFSDGNGLILSTERLDGNEFVWGEEIESRGWGSSNADYANFWKGQMTWRVLQEAGVDYHATIPQLRAKAKELGIKPLPAKRDELFDALIETLATAAPREENDPGQWPGWFHYGNLLVLRATDDSPTARVLRRLVRAAKDGTLGIGGSGSGNPFARGFFLYETRDETEGMNEQIDAAFAYHAEKMAAAQPAADFLNSIGLRAYFLGNPRPSTGKGRVRFPDEPENDTCYWVNGLRPQGYSYSAPAELREAFGDEDAQLFMKNDLSGWFTASELQDIEFLRERLHERVAERAERAERYSKTA